MSTPRGASGGGHAPVRGEDLERYRAELERCRAAAVESAEMAIAAIMGHNGLVLSQIDAALAELAPRQGESAFEHRRRVEAAIAELGSPEMTFER